MDEWDSSPEVERAMRWNVYWCKMWGSAAAWLEASNWRFGLATRIG